MKEYAAFDAMGLAELVRTGEVSPKELLDEAVTRAQAAQEKLNCFSALYPEMAEAQLAAARDGHAKAVARLGQQHKQIAAANARFEAQKQAAAEQHPGPGCRGCDVHDGAERDDRRHPNEATQGGAASTQAREVGVRVEQCLVRAVECAPIAPPLTLSHPVGHGRRCTRGCALEPRPRRAEVCARCATRRRRVRDDVTNQTAEARQHGRTREGGAAKVFAAVIVGSPPIRNPSARKDEGGRHAQVAPRPRQPTLLRPPALLRQAAWPTTRTTRTADSCT